MSDGKGLTGEARLFATLAKVDTPSICNAIEIASGQRRDLGFTRKTMVMPPLARGVFAGRALTATLRSTKRPGAGESVDRRIEYFRYVAKPGAVIVIEDLDDPPGLGAFWGEVHSTVHAALGVAGVVTNGSVRDLDDLHPDLPILAGEVTPSHAFVDIEDMDVAVKVNGMDVSPGDVVHADKHGAVVIPDDLLDGLPEALEKLARKEKVILEMAKKDGFDLGNLEDAMRASREIH